MIMIRIVPYCSGRSLDSRYATVSIIGAADFLIRNPGISDSPFHEDTASTPAYLRCWLVTVITKEADKSSST